MTFTPIPKRIEALVFTAISAAQDAGVFPATEDTLAVPVNRAKNPEMGHYAVAAMALARPFKMKPFDIANQIVAHLPTNDLLENVDVAAPGFINFRLKQGWITDQVDMIIKEDKTAFAQDLGKGRTVNVEFVSANPTGPIHIGRTRGAVVGDGIGRLLEFCGWQVHREYYFNNGGRQMQMLGETLQLRYQQVLGQAVELGADHYQGAYLRDMAADLVAAHGDSWLDKEWLTFKEYAETQIFGIIETTLARLGIKFDLFFNELDVYGDGSVWKVRDDLEARGHTYQAIIHESASEEEREKALAKSAEPATYFRSTAFGDDQDRVIVRSNGEPTYVLPDVAYHVNKLSRGFDRLVDIFGSDHFTEAQTVDRALQALGYDTSAIDVVLTQWVHLERDGEIVGMSTRAGQYVTLDEIIDEIGPDAIRYFMVNRSTDSTINFDLNLAVKQSNDNPVFYIQNAHVRCAGIFRQLESRDYLSDWDKDADLSLLNEEELEFIMKMLEFPDMVIFAYDNLAPHHIANWALELARAFHPLYEHSRVLAADVDIEVAKARLRLYRAAKIVFGRILHLMGMSAPEEM